MQQLLTRVDELLAQIKAQDAPHRRTRSQVGQPPKTPDNSSSDRALRPSVIFPKVANGFRSAWGATAYAALCSIVQIGHRNGRSALTAIRDALATPNPAAAGA